MDSGEIAVNAVDTAATRRGRRLYVTLAVIVALVLPTYYGLTHWLAVRATNQMIEMLATPRPARQKMAAWQAAEQKNVAVGERIAAALRAGKVAEADIREAFLQALGRLPAAADAELLTRFAVDDSEPEVRQAAWLALARAFPAQARLAAAKTTEPNEPWDQLGRANARVRAGDMAAVAELVQWARGGDEEQRRVASAGLNSGVVPVLQAIGQWPRALTPASGTAWSAALLDTVAQVCARGDLQPVADHYHTQREATAEVVRDVERMTSARGWIARILFAF